MVAALPPPPPAAAAPMNVWGAISSQRAVRFFADRPIEPELLDKVLRAGRRAPSAKNQQRWSFIVCTERDRLQRLAGVGPYAGHVAGAAAAVALVTPAADDERARRSIAFDLGQCAQNMMLAAWELGIGSVHASVFRPDLAREILSYPEGYRCDYVLSLGYPVNPDDLTRPSRRGGRKPLDALVHRERWWRVPGDGPRQVRR